MCFSKRDPVLVVLDRRNHKTGEAARHRELRLSPHFIPSKKSSRDLPRKMQAISLPLKFILLFLSSVCFLLLSHWTVHLLYLYQMSLLL